jgi:hypothetical protein
VVETAAVCDVGEPEEDPVGPALDMVPVTESVVPEAEAVAALGGAVENDGEEGVPPVEVLAPDEVADEDVGFVPNPVAVSYKFNSP